MIILYNPPSSASRKPVLPMSLLALGALLESDHEYQIIDGNLEQAPLSRLEQVIAESRARIIGITVMPGQQLSHAVPLCRQLKAAHPELTIIWGGYFPTQHPEACLRSPYVDYVIRGYGEVAFRNLVECLEKKQDPSHVPGLAFRTQPPGPGGRPAIQVSPISPVPHPDHLPDFPYHRVDVGRYVRSTFMGSRTLAHHSSYGCPFRCAFCSVVRVANGRWLAQSAERTASVVRRLVDQWGIDAVEFYDNNFFVQEARTAEFAERIMDLGLGWWGEGRIDTLLGYSDRTWELMRKSGLRMCYLGAESGSDETLGQMNKGGSASTEKTLAFVQKTREYRIIPELCFMFGIPPDPEADARQTIEFVRKVKSLNPATEIIFYMYTPVPPGDDQRAADKGESFQFPQTLEEWISPAWQEFSRWRVISAPGRHDALRRQVIDFRWVLNAHFPTSTNVQLAGWRRFVPRVLSAWRYHLRAYRYPIELRLLNRLLAYQRQETIGF